jgi:hypothetical protein
VVQQAQERPPSIQRPVHDALEGSVDRHRSDLG